MVIPLPDWQTSFAAAISALVLALLASNQIFIIASATRKRLYRNRKESKRRRVGEAASYVNRMIPPPSSGGNTFAKIANTLGDQIKLIHEEAKIAQDKHYKALTRSLSSIVIGFIILSADQTVFANSSWFNLFTNWADLLAVGITFYAFIQANRYNRQWVIARLQTELMRQRSILIYMGSTEVGSAKNRWEQEAIYVGRVLHECHLNKDFERAVKHFFEDFCRDLPTLKKSGVCFNSEFVRIYLHGRVLSQLRWFGSAAESVVSAEQNREKLLRTLFIACVFVVIARGLAIHFYPVTQIASSLSFCSVLIFGASVCLTTDEIGRNQKILSYQYILQYHRIEEWLENFVSAHGDFIQGQKSEVHIEADLIKFEKIMVDELCNWIYTSRGERLSLAP